MVLDQSSVLQQLVRIGLPAEAPPALELAARVPQNAHLAGAGEIGAEPGQVEVGVHQLEQDVPLAEEQNRKPLGHPPSTAQGPHQGSWVFLHCERRGHPAGTGLGHETAVGLVVVLAGEIQKAEALLRLGHHFHVVGLTVIGESTGEGETLGEPTGAASGKSRDDDASAFPHWLSAFGVRNLEGASRNVLCRFAHPEERSYRRICPRPSDHSLARSSRSLRDDVSLSSDFR